MTDTAAAGPFHVRIDADVRVRDAGRLGGRSDDELAALLTGLIQRHAGEAGLDLPDPSSVRVEVTRTNGAVG